MIQPLKLTIVYALFVLLISNNLYSHERIISVVIDDSRQFQVINNFGASGCWYAEAIGKYWADAKKEKLAEMLFSKDTVQDGSPKGLGLSAWRFNIGAGTAEQGDNSGIEDVNRRVECFMDNQQKYDWSKCIGSQWFIEKAKEYGVSDLIAFVNSPPVFYNKNGLGYLLQDGNTSNLREDKYRDFSLFLATIIDYFEQKKIHFNYLSPINEPQWKWRYEFGKAQQEGTPYTNEEIYKLIKSLDSILEVQHLTTKILFPEAAKLDFMTDGNLAASNQLECFWSQDSPSYLGATKNVARIAASHGYFTDNGDDAIRSFRDKMAVKTAKYDLKYWQTEYSMLGDGYKEGGERRTTLDCGLFLAKIIHYDLTVGNASAWQFWNAFEPGNSLWDTRYSLFAIKPKNNWKDGDFFPTANFYALGHFSYFIKPGMQRIKINIGDKNDYLLVSAYQNFKTKKTVLVIINYGIDELVLKIKSKHGIYKMYETDETHHLQYIGKLETPFLHLSGRAIYTLESIDK